MIEILNTEEVLSNPGTFAFFMLLGYFIIVFLIIGIFSKDIDVKKPLLLIVGGLLMLESLLLFLKPFESEIHLSATINEDADFNDIYDNYEIIEQKNKIFILKEKGVN